MECVTLERMPDTLICDLDETLLRSMGMFETGLQAVLEAGEYDLEIPSHEVVRHNFHGTLEEAVSGVLGLAPDRDADRLDKIIAAFLENQDSYYGHIEPHLYDDALGLLGRIKAWGDNGDVVQQILVTSRAHKDRLRASPRHIVQNSVLRNYFGDAVICGDDSEHRKPDIRVLGDYVLKGSGNGDRSAVLVIGDQWVDAQLAVNLGGQAIVVDRHGEGIPHLEEKLSAAERARHVTVVRSFNDVLVSAG